MNNKILNRILYPVIGFIFGLVSYTFIIVFRDLSGYVGTVSLNVSSSDFLLRFLFILMGVTVEEVICRKYLYSALKKVSHSWLIAAAVSSIIFSVLHIHESRGIADYAFYFMFGMLLCIVVKNTGSVLAAIGIHAGWNLLSGQSILLVEYTIDNRQELLYAKLYNVIWMFLLCVAIMLIQNIRKKSAAVIMQPQDL